MDVEVPGSKRGNVQTGDGGWDRVSTISLLGCGTSVALATGPTDEEEEAPLTGPCCTDLLITVHIMQRIYSSDEVPG